MKVCRRCKLTKQEYDFYKSKRSKDGLTCYCKRCTNEYNSIWSKNHPDAKKRICNRSYQNTGRRDYFERKYGKCGLSLIAYDHLTKLQNNVCAICGNVAKLYVDHDHKTNQVRGFLCHKCNSMIGFAQDDTNILLNGVNYLLSPPYIPC